MRNESASENSKSGFVLRSIPQAPTAMFARSVRSKIARDADNLGKWMIGTFLLFGKKSVS
jgi:hypothetical protein